MDHHHGEVSEWFKEAEVLKTSDFRKGPWVRIPPSPPNAQIAQSVEQGTENPCVDGSIPPLGTINVAV